MRNFTIRLFIILAITGLSSCDEKKQKTGPDVPTMKPEITSFSFLAEKNEVLKGISYTAGISGNVISVDFKGVPRNARLTPDVEGKFKAIKINGVLLESGAKVIALNEENEVIAIGYTSQQETRYTLKINFFESLPRVDVYTDAPITSKEEYIGASYRFSQCPGIEDMEITGKIKGRGNSTWTVYPKKPYKIKLDEKASVFGMNSNKKWVLLAEYCDKSLLRTTYLFTMSKFLGLPWTPAAIHVNLYHNGVYQGIYFLTESVDTGKKRVPCEDDGFLIEDDNYYNMEPLYMHTPVGLHFTFKYPDPEDGEIAYGDESWNWLWGFVNNLENALKADNFTDLVNGYRKYLDVDSFAKWYIVQEVLANLNTNHYYCILSRKSKLESYPVWDGEWMLGLASPGHDGNWQRYPEEPLFKVDTPVYGTNWYYAYLFRDPYFVKYVYDTWREFKAKKLPQVREAIVKEANILRVAQEDNFKVWQIMGIPVSVEMVVYNSWQEYVSFTNSWFEKRVEWFDNYIRFKYENSRK